jgi:hypothetical protein
MHPAPTGRLSGGFFSPLLVVGSYLRAISKIYRTAGDKIQGVGPSIYFAPSSVI